MAKRIVLPGTVIALLLCGPRIGTVSAQNGAPVQYAPPQPIAPMITGSNMTPQTALGIVASKEDEINLHVFNTDAVQRGQYTTLRETGTLITALTDTVKAQDERITTLEKVHDNQKTGSLTDQMIELVIGSPGALAFLWQARIVQMKRRKKTAGARDDED